MTDNVLQLWPSIWAVLGGTAVLLIFAFALGLPTHPRMRPGSKGHRPSEQQTEHEEIVPDGYIDSFAGEIEEAGGSMPPVVKLAIPGILLWWLLYLIFNWAPK